MKTLKVFNYKTHSICECNLKIILIINSHQSNKQSSQAELILYDHAKSPERQDTGDVTELWPGDRDGDQDRFVSSSAKNRFVSSSVRNRLPIVGSGKGVEKQLNQWRTLSKLGLVSAFSLIHSKAMWMYLKISLIESSLPSSLITSWITSMASPLFQHLIT